MSTVSIDHIAMPTANAERLIEFYKRLGFTINDEEEWRGRQGKHLLHSDWRLQDQRSPRGLCRRPAGALGGPRLRRHLLRLGRHGRGMPRMVGRRRRRGYSWPGTAQGRKGIWQGALPEPLRPRPRRQLAGMDDLPLAGDPLALTLSLWERDSFVLTRHFSPMRGNLILKEVAR